MFDPFKSKANPSYFRGAEVSRDARSGQVIGVYGVGDKGSKTIVATDRGGEGSVTAHRDGNFHRHGDSAHVAGGKESYSKDGKISPNRIK